MPALVVGVIGAETGPDVLAYPLPNDNTILRVAGSLVTAICSETTSLGTFDPGSYSLSAAATSIGRTVLQSGI